MSTGFTIDSRLATLALTSPRLGFLGRVGTDLSTIGTWDPRLPRRTRILVPVDVQAYVARADVAEPTVDLRGAADDPAPFAEGTARQPGVHLHWAMPDALLGVRHDQSTGGPSVTPLPDAWVVVRTLQPVGAGQAVATGWQVDARTAVVTPLGEYLGPASPLPDGAFDPVTATTSGALWTASYAASAGRFGFHDPLSDLDGLLATVAPKGFDGDQAGYTVAGWWTDAARDPLDGARGPAGLDTALAALGRRVEHDVDDDDIAEPDKRGTLLASRLGLRQPVEHPAPQVYDPGGGKVGGLLHGVALEAGYPVADADAVRLGDRLPTYHCLLHGSVLGVPVGADPLPEADDRPAPDALSVAVGTDVDDVVAAFGAAGLGLPPDARRLAEDLLAAFSMGAVSRLGSADGLDEVAAREHENGFWSLPGSPLEAARLDRLRVEDTLPVGPDTVGRKGRGSGVAAEAVAGLAWRSTIDLVEPGRTRLSGRRRVEEATRPPASTTAQARSVPRPAPRYVRPQPPLVALRGAHPSHRHHGDGLADGSGTLLCRYPRSAVPRWDGLVDGAVVLPSLGSWCHPARGAHRGPGGRPAQPLRQRLRAVVAGAPDDSVLEPFRTRLAGGIGRLYGTEGRYDGTTPLDPVPAAAAQAGDPWAHEVAREQPEYLMVTAVLAGLSTLRGTPPSPVALTTWRQPWVPLWLEWQVTLGGSDTLRGWHLDGLDLEADTDGAAEPLTFTLHGRSPVGQGVGEALRAAVAGWLHAENQRAVTNGSDPYGTAAVLAQLGTLDRPLDLVSASLDGIREQLLGITYVGQVLRDPADRPIASRTPTVLFGGTLRLDALRLVDAFGRTLAAPDAVLDRTVSTVQLEVPERPRTVRLRPRFQGSARWLLRLLDADQPPGTPTDTLREAYVDQLEPEAAPNPVSGFLLPDHIDESLEAFHRCRRPGGRDRPRPDRRGGHLGAGAGARRAGRRRTAGRDRRAGPAGRRGGRRPGAGGRRCPGTAAGSAPGRKRAGEPAAGRRHDAVDRLRRPPPPLGAGTVAGLVGRPIAVVRGVAAARRARRPRGGDRPGRGRRAGRRPGSQGALRRAGRRAGAGAAGRPSPAATTRCWGTSSTTTTSTCTSSTRCSPPTPGSPAAPSASSACWARRPHRRPPPSTTPTWCRTGCWRVRAGQTRMLTLLMLPMGMVHLTSGSAASQGGRSRGQLVHPGAEEADAIGAPSAPCSSTLRRSGCPWSRCSATSRPSRGAPASSPGGTTRSWPPPRRRTSLCSRTRCRRAGCG